MPDDLASYLRKNVAKPLDWSLGGNDYRIDIVTVDDGLISAAVERYVDDPFRQRPRRVYVGEARIPIGRDDSREVVLDRLVHQLDADNLSLGTLDRRMRAIEGLPPATKEEIAAQFVTWPGLSREESEARLAELSRKMSADP